MQFKRLVVLIVIAFGATWVLRSFVFESISIASASMEPTLLVGTHFFADKLTLRFRNPVQGDIIVFASPVAAGEELVKRVIGVAGDSVELREKKVFVNGRELDESYAKHTRSGEKLVGDDLGPMQVPTGQLFVLGDNRDESNDSASWKDPQTGKRVYFVHVSAVRAVLRGFY